MSILFFSLLLFLFSFFLSFFLVLRGVKTDMLAGEALRAETDDEMVGVNLAVCLLYVGRMQEVRWRCPALLTVDRHPKLSHDGR